MDITIAVMVQLERALITDWNDERGGCEINYWGSGDRVYQVNWIACKRDFIGNWNERTRLEQRFKWNLDSQSGVFIHEGEPI